jgi:Repeat of unknown function (DUF5648)/RTX calcium-binding nonapeptide repeat (4 copies)
MLFQGTDGNDTLQGTDGNDTLQGEAGNDLLFSGNGDDLISGGDGNDSLYGGDQGEAFFTTGGGDTLSGGEDQDFYYISLENGGGSVIQDESANDSDIAILLAENSDISTLVSSINATEQEILNLFNDPNTWGDSAITLSRPQQGIVGLEKSGTDLIIDLNRDGVAEASDDLTITNTEGNLGTGAPFLINNITDQQSVIDFFAGNSNTTVYRFLNNDTGVHFYTANPEERDAVEQLDNYSFEGVSYQGIDPLTGQGNSVPVYRFLNEDTGVHLYTVSEEERNAVQELDNFSFEGEAFFAYKTQIDGSIPIYRFFNPTTGAHFYTPSTTERDNVENNLSDFQSEGIAYYALPSDEGL